jgi:hypothetical protein
MAKNKDPNDGDTCTECPNYEPDPSGETEGRCKHPDSEGTVLTKEYFT